MKIFSWGSNSHGQLGLGVEFEQIPVPKPIIINDNVMTIVGGGKHTLLLTEDRKLYSCGDNDQGQLSKERAVKRLLSFQEIICKIEIVKVSCGWDFNLAITSQGDVFGWGGNTYGQLGMPQQTVKFVCGPVRVFNEKAIDIGCGLRHSLIIGKEGFSYSAGFGKKGQLGIPFDRVKISNVFTQVPSINKARKVSCGEQHSIICTTEDRIYAFGDNKFGQLGIDPSILPRSEVPVLLPFHIGKIATIVSGWVHNAVLTDDGEVFTWGRNDYGQLGENRQENWKPKSVRLLSGTKQIALGSNHGVALKSTGEILCWGWNEHGNCGNGTCDNVYEPAQLNTSGSRPEFVGTGSAHSFFCAN